MDIQTQKIKNRLIRKAEKRFAEKPRAHEFTGHPKADRMLNDLRRFPHAFVIGCLVDKQMTAQKSWLIPYELRQRLGYFNLKRLNGTPLRTFERAMKKPTVLHRFPDVMADQIKQAFKLIKEKHKGSAANIWADKPSSATIVKQFLEFKGMGPKLATMSCNILVRDFRIPVSDRYSVDVSIDVHVRRVFGRLGLTPEYASNEMLIYTARALNPEYPGIFDFVMHRLGKEICRLKSPRCDECFMKDLCPSRE